MKSFGKYLVEIAVEGHAVLIELIYKVMNHANEICCTKKVYCHRKINKDSLKFFSILTI